TPRSLFAMTSSRSATATELEDGRGRIQFAVVVVAGAARPGDADRLVSLDERRGESLRTLHHRVVGRREQQAITVTFGAAWRRFAASGSPGRLVGLATSKGPRLHGSGRVQCEERPWEPLEWRT